MRSDNQESEESGGVDAESGSPKDVIDDQPDGADGPIGAESARAGTTATDAKALEELDSMKERYLRLAAEYDNYRKRTERERAETRDRSQGQLMEKLLEPLDDLQRVGQFNVETATIESLLEGVRMVDRKLMRALEALGLETVVPRGERFNPAEHEAVMVTGASEEDEDETVGEVFQPGYRFRGMLLRPARVQVRKYEG